MTAEATDDHWQLGVSGSHSVGAYGTGSDTRITSVAASVRYLLKDGDIGLLMPYLSISGQCSVTLIAGIPNRTGGTCPVQTRVTRNGRVVQRTLNQQTTESGPGDVLLQGRYYALDELHWIPTVAIFGQLKAPTADPDKGLGTGKFDERIGLEVSKSLTTNLLAFVDGGYTVVGKPDNVPLRNQPYYDMGVGYYWLERRLVTSVYYEWWRSVVSGLQDPQDLLLAINYKFTPAFRLNGSLALGLSDGAPRTAFTGGASVRF